MQCLRSPGSPSFPTPPPLSFSPFSLYFQAEENSSFPCIPLTFQLWFYLLYLSSYINIHLFPSIPPLPFPSQCLLSLHIALPPLPPLSFPACSSRPVEAGGSPEPSTPSRGSIAQPCWLAGSLAHLQHLRTHTHMLFSSLLAFLLSLSVSFLSASLAISLYSIFFNTSLFCSHHLCLLYPI